MNLDYRIEHVDHNSGQEDMELGLYNADNDEIIGMVQYTLYDGEISVKDIIVRPEFRRKGFGSRMMQYIKKHHPDHKYVPSMKTDLGAKFKHKEIMGDIKKFNEFKSSDLIEEGWKDWVAGAMMALATALPKTADAQQDGVVDWDTVKDTVEYISTDMDRDTVRAITTKAYKIFKDNDGNIDKIVTDIKDEYTHYNSWDIDSSKTDRSSEIEKMDPETEEMVRLTTSDGKRKIYVNGDYMRTPEEVKNIYYDNDDSNLDDKYHNYVDKYNHWLSLFDKSEQKNENRTMKSYWEFINESDDAEKNLERSRDVLSKFGMDEPIRKYMTRLSNTNDLWEYDKLTMELEDDESLYSGPGSGGPGSDSPYTSFHRDFAPKWAREKWNSGEIEFAEMNLKEDIINQITPQMEKYMEEKGLSSELAMIAYEVGSDGPDDEYFPLGKFKMGFNVWKENEEGSDENGLCYFEFNVPNYGSLDRVEFKEKEDWSPESGHSRLEHSDFKVGVGCVMGKGDFRKNEFSTPGSDLVDWLGDGGVVLMQRW